MCIKYHFYFVFLFLFVIQSISSQIKISGKVVDRNKAPVVGASVYIDNTTIGTTTDDTGEFQLDLEEGSYNLVISFVGFETLKYILETDTYKKITFRLRDAKNVLDEIVITNKKKKISKSKRRSYLKTFKKYFLGESKIAQSCKIVNESALIFNYNKKTKTLRVKAKEPLSIINPTLGYVLEYDLFDFRFQEKGIYVFNRGYFTYRGFVRFTKMKGSKKEEAEWLENRYKAYLGSEMHFFYSAVNERVTEERFRVDHIKRIKNPLYPTNDEIKLAKDILDFKKSAQIKFSKMNSAFANPVDYAEDIMRRSKLDPFTYEEEIRLKLFRYGFYDGKNIFLRFTDWLRIIYFDKPDKNFKSTQKNKNIQYTLLKSTKGNNIIIKRPGYAFNPDEIYKEEYWAFKRVGDLLPTNYTPPK